MAARLKVLCRGDEDVERHGYATDAPMEHLQGVSLSHNEAHQALDLCSDVRRHDDDVVSRKRRSAVAQPRG